MLHSRFPLAICFIYSISSICVSIPIPPTTPPFPRERVHNPSHSFCLGTLTGRIHLSSSPDTHEQEEQLLARGFPQVVMNWLFWTKAIGSDQMPLGMPSTIYHSDKSALGFMYFRFIIAVLAESRRCLCMPGMWRVGETVTWPEIVGRYLL